MYILWACVDGNVYLNPAPSVLSGDLSSLPSLGWVWSFLELYFKFLLIFYSFRALEYTPAFIRVIHQEEMWLYKNPKSQNTISTELLFVSAILIGMNHLDWNDTQLAALLETCLDIMLYPLSTCSTLVGAI